MPGPFAPTARDLFAAIMANDSPRVNRILDDGQLDPDVDMHEQDIPLFRNGVFTFEGAKVFRQASVDTSPTALHVAILSFFHNLKGGNRGQVALSFDIVRQLLDFGADSSVSISNMSYVFRGVSYRCETAMTPIELAACLNQLTSVVNDVPSASASIWSNRLINLLRSTPSVLHHPVTETYEKMLFSERLSDVKFVCGDEVIVHAHKNVLAASSQYFDAAFDGPWKESESGEWMTSHPSHVIKVVFTLLYTGKMDIKLVEEDPLAFISVASEYDLASLKCVAERCCIQLVNADNIKATLQAAHLYDSAILKNACVDFVKKNALTVLAYSRISSLESEYPDLWEEFKKTIVS